jgi:hypothetical protein
VLAVPSAEAGTGIAFSGFQWHVHSGVNKAGQCQSPSHVSVSGGTLIERISGGCGGGVSMAVDKHFGTWTFTYRMTRGGGKYNFLLWPQNGSRPEVDAAEDKPTDSSRSLVTGTYHPKPGCTSCIHVKTTGDFTQWHTLAVKWTSSGFSLIKDGKQWAHFNSSYGGKMHLAIQSAPWGSNGTSTLYVSKVTMS